MATKFMQSLDPEIYAELRKMAKDRGITMQELIRAASPRPQDQQRLSQLVAQMERWIGNYGRVRLYTDVALLETADAVVMRELYATTSVEEQLLHSISPTLHLLKRPGAERLIEELKRRGQTPLLHNEEYYGAE